MTSPSVAASWATLVPLAWDSATLASYTDWPNVGVLSLTFVTLTVNVPVPCNNTLDVWLCVFVFFACCVGFNICIKKDIICYEYNTALHKHFSRETVRGAK